MEPIEFNSSWKEESMSCPFTLATIDGTDEYDDDEWWSSLYNTGKVKCQNSEKRPGGDIHATMYICIFYTISWSVPLSLLSSIVVE